MPWRSGLFQYFWHLCDMIQIAIAVPDCNILIINGLKNNDGAIALVVMTICQIRRMMCRVMS